MPDEPSRSIELEVEVPGTPEEVWRAIATGPGISSWYVPHTVEEREGGDAVISFGPGMEVTGRVAAWDPPRRVVFDGGEGMEALAYEWLVESRDGGSTVVRLVNTGFGSGEEWDAQYDGMTDGWPLFLRNLQLHMEHFRGESATAMLPGASWPGPQDDALARLLAELGIAGTPQPGDRFEVTAADAPPLAGTVADIASWKVALVLDAPTPGTAFMAAERNGDTMGMSVWCYLYGADGAATAERDFPRWQSWLDSHA